MIRTTLLTTTAALLLAGAAGAQDRVVNVYNWSDYIDEAALEQFTEETGIRVVYDVYDSNEVLEAKLLAGGSGYDVVVPTGTFLARQIQAGVYQPLDKSEIPNLEHMWPQIEERVAKYDPGNDHSVNYMWGTTGIGYNVAAVQERLGQDTINSWDVLFDPEKARLFADCGIMVLDAPEETMRAAMNYLGIDPDSTDAADYERAAELWMEIRPSIQKFHSSEYINALANGDICLALGWSGDVLQARDRAAEAGAGVEVGYSIPDEGALMWFDNFAIPADASNVEEAHAFIDFMNRPEIAAQNVNYINYPSGNEDAQEFVDDQILNDPAIYPSASAIDNLYVVSPFDPRLQRAVTRLWTQVRTGQ